MNRAHGVLPPDACSVTSASLQEPLAGTAPSALVWIAIEQAGPWGAKALRESHLPLDVGSDLDTRIADLPIRPVLIRRPGTHIDVADDQLGTRRVILLAYSGADPSAPPWLVSTVTVDDADLAAAVAELDLELLVAGGMPDGRWTPVPGPVVLICTNGKRDTCCAVSGRHLLDDVIHSLPDPHAPVERLWECSHPGGHRFAPTVVGLPAGHVLGRPTAPDVHDLLAGRIPVHALRGRSALSPPEQAAEVAVLGYLADEGLSAGPLSLARTEGSNQVLVESPEAGRWSIEVRPQDSGRSRPESCGKADLPMISWVTSNLIHESIV